MYNINSLIRAYEEELRDSTEYYRWQTELKQKDAQAKREQAERKRAAAKLSAATSREAIEQQETDNRELVARVKEEKAAMALQRKVRVLNCAYCSVGNSTVAVVVTSQ
jgi:uncharacterized membrane protein YqiK